MATGFGGKGLANAGHNTVPNPVPHPVPHHNTVPHPDPTLSLMWTRALMPTLMASLRASGQPCLTLAFGVQVRALGGLWDAIEDDLLEEVMGEVKWLGRMASG